jgi:hypothetical protein
MYDARSLLDNTLGSLDLSPRLETAGFSLGIVHWFQDSLS